MNKVKFLFGIHNHQPIGNFDFVFEEAYQKSYKPFVEILEKHPKMKISIHFTGILIDWLEINHPELLELVKKLVQKGQVEILTGGYYEPIMSVIPKKDRVGQILKLTKKVKEVFEFEARGMWLAERVWEPTLPTTLSEAKIEYTFIDDTHFKYAGLEEKQLNGIYITENLGQNLKLFPISKRLRYTIPFEEPQSTLDHLRSLVTDNGENVVVFADDGEKFGVWPNTFDHVYTHGWLDRFFTAIESNLDWIELIHFSEAVDTVKPMGRIYLPTASYAEMMHWSLFPGAFQKYENFEHYLKNNQTYDDYGVFVRGGFWRNFLAKYREVNDMHKKMLRVSHKVWRLEKTKKEEFEKALDHLWAAQCNCPYWHGVFGGIYLSHIRNAIYSNLIQAEKLVDKINSTKFPVILKEDIDVDGREELVLETEHLTAYFSPDKGGMMYELDYKPLNKNILDTMTRRKEGYHSKLSQAKNEIEGGSASIHDIVLAKEPDLESKLFYDFYDRKSFVDHFLAPEINIDNFSKSDFTEMGDFYNAPYELIEIKTNKTHSSLVLRAQGIVNNKHVLLTKKIIFELNSAEITAEYKLENLDSGRIITRFGVEFNFGLQAGHAHDRYYYTKNGKPEDFYLDSKGVFEKSDFIGLKDEWRGLDISLHVKPESDIWRFPIETISLSEAGFERVYQNSAVLISQLIDFEKSWETNVIIRIKSM